MRPHQTTLLDDLEKLDPNDERLPMYRRQQEDQGWNDTDTWRLDRTFAKFALPRLRRYRELSDVHPNTLPDMAEWHAVLDEMIYAFDQVANGDEVWMRSRVVQIRIKYGLNFFAKYFTSLWW